MKKKMIGLGLLFFSLCLPGCGDRGQTDSAKEEPVKLTLMTPNWGHTRFEEIVEAQFPEVELEVLSYPEEQFYTVLKTKLATGSGPDFMDVQFGYAGSNGVKSLAEAGYLLPLDQARLKWLGQARQESRVLAAGDEVYGFSANSMMLGVLYNKEMFAQCGLSLPRCWEDFLECCESLKENGIQPIMGSGGDSTSLQYGPYQIAANRLYPRDPQYDAGLRSGKVRFTDVGTWDKVLEQYFSLFDKGYITKESIAYSSTDAMEKLGNGEAAMLIAVSLYIRDLTEGENGETAYGFMPLPANERGKPLYACKSVLGNICGYTGSGHTELCREILEAYYNDAGYGEFDESFASILDPCYRDLPSCYFCNQGWPNEVEIVLENKIREYISGENCGIEDITGAMQRELEK